MCFNFCTNSRCRFRFLFSLSATNFAVIFFFLQLKISSLGNLFDSLCQNFVFGFYRLPEGENLDFKICYYVKKRKNFCKENQQIFIFHGILENLLEECSKFWKSVLFLKIQEYVQFLSKILPDSFQKLLFNKILNFL